MLEATLHWFRYEIGVIYGATNCHGLAKLKSGLIFCELKSQSTFCSLLLLSF